MMETHLVVLQKVRVTESPSNFTARKIPKRNENTCSHKNSTQISIAALFIMPSKAAESPASAPPQKFEQ